MQGGSLISMLALTILEVRNREIDRQDCPVASLKERRKSRLVTVRSKRRGKLFDRRTGKAEFKFSIGADFLN